MSKKIIIPLEKGTLLYQFIKSRLDSHKEPIRKGIKRGQKIGFGGEKFLVSNLVGCTNYNLREIAKLTGLSYNLVRLWNPEEEFKQIAEESRRKFTRLLTDYITKKTRELQWKKFEASVYPEIPVRELEEERFNAEEHYEKEITRVLKDAAIYNDSISNAAVKTVSSLFTAEEMLYITNPRMFFVLLKSLFGERYKEKRKQLLKVFIDDKSYYFYNTTPTGRKLTEQEAKDLRMLILAFYEYIDSQVPRPY